MGAQVRGFSLDKSRKDAFHRTVKAFIATLCWAHTAVGIYLKLRKIY
jgi:hypothetical protein